MPLASHIVRLGDPGAELPTEFVLSYKPEYLCVIQ
jgi:hypothetical protein